MTNFEKIVQGGAGALAGLFDNFLKLPDTTKYCKKEVNCRLVGDCRTCFLAWLNSPAEPTKPTKPTLTEDEEIFVRWAVEFGFEWAARDTDGILRLHELKPQRLFNLWCSNDELSNNIKVNADKYPFSFVKWEDAEPVFLPDLLGV